MSLAVRLFGGVARAVPRSWADRVGAFLGWGWYRLVPIRRRVARQNLEQAFPELDVKARERIVAGMYRHLGLCLVELLRFGARDPGQLAASLHVEGRAHLEAALAEGRGVLVLTAHLGNWEVLVRAGTLCGAPLSVVTKSMRSPVAQAAWRALRRGGPELLPDRDSARRIVAALKRNEVVGYVLDQHAPRGLRVPFFGRPAQTHDALARLAKATGAVVLPVFTWRSPEGHRVRIETPVALGADPTESTRRYVARVEAAIRARPEQWLWIHRRWK